MQQAIHAQQTNWTCIQQIRDQRTPPPSRLAPSHTAGDSLAIGMARGGKKRKVSKCTQSRKDSMERARHAQKFAQHPATSFRTDMEAVRRALTVEGTLCTGDKDKGHVSGGRYTRLTPEAAKRVAAVVRGPAADAAVRAVYAGTGTLGQEYRGKGMLVDACIIDYDSDAEGFQSYSTHVDGCPNAGFGSGMSACTINLLIQLDGRGLTGQCPFPPDKFPHLDEATEGYLYCAERGLHTCDVGAGLAILTSSSHAPLPQKGRKLVLTLYFAPPRGRKSTAYATLCVRRAWADSAENGWRAEGREATPAYGIAWEVEPAAV